MSLWRSKLAAYLHDPPSKCLDIANHGERSDAAFRQAGFVDTEIGEYFAHADHAGAAADRLPFPSSQASGLQCAFDGVRNAFLHPLSGERLRLHGEFRSVEQGFEGEQSIQPALSAESLVALKDNNDCWRARFFAHWRLWPKHAMEKDYRLALLPADTRIPDHSIWTHMQVVSALAGCVGSDDIWRPAFLKFQLGPVQDFIAAARSIRDLWSGSYLLSWLMAAGLKALSESVGPDAVIFPNLRGQPLFDLHWRKELWSEVSISGQSSVWDSLGWGNRELLTPNLPNVFLAVVPAQQAGELGRAVEEAIRAEWKCIAEAVWKECQKAGLTADEKNEKGETVIAESEREKRFYSQSERLLSPSWQVTLWPGTLDEAMKLADGFVGDTPIAQARAQVQRVVDMAEKQMPKDHRDGRFYVGGKEGPKEKLNNIGLGWSVILARNGWELDAVRQTRAFATANGGGWAVGTFSNKDALNGREEAVAGGREWVRRAEAAKGFWPSLFKKNDWLGASTLIKRLWHRAYLAAEPWKLQTDSRGFPMPNTRGVAAHDPYATDDRFNDEEQADDVENQPAAEKHFAVLAFDGDQIGKWISGEKTPPFATQLADYTDGSQAQRYGSKPYFGKAAFGDILEVHRPLSPSYHLQFSEALSNFALLCARPIVEGFDGRLIYAGGDDVVALLPADTALECAQALRMAFRGDTGLKKYLREKATTLKERHDAQRTREPKAAEAPYFQKLAAEGCLLEAREAGFVRRLDYVDQQEHPIPFLVPGPKADCSVGIAIAHFKSPLQDVVRAAQQAEQRAKRATTSGGQGRRAVAVTLMKRSGEIIEWGAKWDGGLDLYQALAAGLDAEQLSGKFPHRFAELLEAYVTASTPLLREAYTLRPFEGFPTEDVIVREFDHCLSRQINPKEFKSKEEANEKRQNLQSALQTYLASLKQSQDGMAESERILRSLIGLCQTVAFAHRTGAEDSNLEPKGNA